MAKADFRPFYRFTVANLFYRNFYLTFAEINQRTLSDYALHENFLVGAPENSYRAQVQYSKTVDFEQIIDRLMERGPAITREDAIAVIRAYSQTIMTLALEGNKVSTPLMSCGISIKGVFVSQTDTFNSSRHSIEATVSPGPEFKRLVREKGQVQQQEANKPQPNPLEYLDLGSGQRNGSISAGRVAQVNGHRLKFDEADPSQGVFFIAADGSESRASLMVKNTARQLIFEAPAGLAAGDYTLEVRANYGQGILRAGRLDSLLTVA